MRSRDSLLRLHRFRVEDIRRQCDEMDMMVQDMMRKHDELDAHDNILRSVGELKDQHNSMVSRLEEESAELRKVELLAEKEAPSVKAPLSPLGDASAVQHIS
jgi:flagellar protein FliJ